MKIKLTKISDDKFNGNHPNGIQEGYITEGEEYFPPVVGTRYHVGHLLTSTVTEILGDGTFKTRNSTYKREVIE